MDALPLHGSEPWPSRSDHPNAPRVYAVTRYAIRDVSQYGTRYPCLPSRVASLSPGTQHLRRPLFPLRAAAQQQW